MKSVKHKKQFISKDYQDLTPLLCSETFLSLLSLIFPLSNTDISS